MSPVPNRKEKSAAQEQKLRRGCFSAAATGEGRAAEGVGPYGKTDVRAVGAGLVPARFAGHRPLSAGDS